jgi:hypothetical protein
LRCVGPVVALNCRDAGQDTTAYDASSRAITSVRTKIPIIIRRYRLGRLLDAKISYINRDCDIIRVADVLPYTIITAVKRS